MPLVAPSQELVKHYQTEQITTKHYFRPYRAEMRATGPKHVNEILALQRIALFAKLQLDRFA